MKLNIRVNNETANRAMLTDLEKQMNVVNAELNKMRQIVANIAPITMEFAEEKENPRQE